MFATKLPPNASNAEHRVHRFAGMAEHATQAFAILISAVFLLSGVVYLYLGRVTCLATGNFWSVYAFSWNHTWFQSALLKQAGHVTFFPSIVGLANLRFFMATCKCSSLPGWGYFS